MQFESRGISGTISNEERIEEIAEYVANAP
jgi:hypothetical protein